MYCTFGSLSTEEYGLGQTDRCRSVENIHPSVYGGSQLAHLLGVPRNPETSTSDNRDLHAPSSVSYESSSNRNYLHVLH
jgi:hypothetical protein